MSQAGTCTKIASGAGKNTVSPRMREARCPRRGSRRAWSTGARPRTRRASRARATEASGRRRRRHRPRRGPSSAREAAVPGTTERGGRGAGCSAGPALAKRRAHTVCEAGAGLAVAWPRRRPAPARTGTPAATLTGLVPTKPRIVESKPVVHGPREQTGSRTRSAAFDGTRTSTFGRPEDGSRRCASEPSGATRSMKRVPRGGCCPLGPEVDRPARRSSRRRSGRGGRATGGAGRSARRACSRGRTRLSSRRSAER